MIASHRWALALSSFSSEVTKLIRKGIPIPPTRPGSLAHSLALPLEAFDAEARGYGGLLAALAALARRHAPSELFLGPLCPPGQTPLAEAPPRCQFFPALTTRTKSARQEFFAVKFKTARAFRC